MRDPQGRTVLDIPLYGAIVVGALLPGLALLSAAVSLALEYTITVEYFQCTRSG